MEKVCLPLWSMPSLSLSPLACSIEVSVQVSSSISLYPCHKNLKLNIAFYHPQHKPDRPCPCVCASLLAAFIIHCGSDIESAHSSGRAAPFMMCPSSTHPLYQQWRGKKNAKLLLNKCWIQNSIFSATAYSDCLADDYLALPPKLQQMLTFGKGAMQHVLTDTITELIFKMGHCQDVNIILIITFEFGDAGLITFELWLSKGF